MIKVLMNQPKNSDIVNVTELTQDAKNLFKSNKI